MRELLYNLMIVCLAIIAPINPLLIACVFLIVCDTITGMMAAKKRGEEITSAEMRRTVSKFLVFNLTIIAGFILEKYMLDGLLPVSKIIAGVIGMAEFKSILENTSTIMGQDILKIFLEKIGSKNSKNIGPSNDKE